MIINTCRSLWTYNFRCVHRLFVELLGLIRAETRCQQLCMPRLLPRLVRVLTSPRKDWLTSTPTSPLFPKPPPKNTRVKATEMPNFTAKRSKSILLDSVNPVMHPKAYQLQKTKHPSVTNDAYVRRLLSEEGIKQRANPYCVHVFNPDARRRC